MFDTISITEVTQRTVFKSFETSVIIGVLKRANESEWGWGDILRKLNLK